MISLPIVDMGGGKVGTYEFDPADLASSINKQLLHDVVVMYERNRRVGTVQTKSRGMVKGSKKKLYRQKGTGRARAGNRRTPIRRGGGHAFGKKPVDYYFRMPKKAVRTATRMALLSKFQDSEASVLSALSLAEIKTKPVADMLKKLGVAGSSTLLVIPDYDKTAYMSARNIADLQIMPVSDLNAYALLRHKRLVIVKDAMDKARQNGQPAGSAA
jgi:large subunit ribosomal protein L4